MLNKKYLSFTSDSINPSWKIDESTKFLVAPVVLARTGVQLYRGFELGLKDRSLDKINVYRSPDEVFSPEAVGSYQNLVITDDHPGSPITIDNVKELQVGTVSNVITDGNVIKGLATITDKDQIQKIQDGKVEVSLGYSQDLKPFNESIDGMLCEFQQTDIRGNHLAVVDAGRCGAACRILNDKTIEDNLSVIKIDGIKHTIEDSKLVDAVKKLQKDAEENELALMEKLNEVKELIQKLQGMEQEKVEVIAEKEDAVKKKDEAEAEKEAMKETQIGDADLKKLISVEVGKKAKLIADASLILGDKMPTCLDCDLDIMKAVIGKSFSEDAIMGKSPEYINAYVTALYDNAVIGHKAGNKTIDNFNKDLYQIKITEDSSKNSPKEEYYKTLGKGVTI